LTCEHASRSLPREYRALGLPRSALNDHIGWDVGAEAVQREVARRLGAPRVASRWSRLLVDCNRDPEDPSLVLEVSDGVRVPGNARLSRAERTRRVVRFHAPYHAAVDRMVARARTAHPGETVSILSIHSFTPVLAGAERKLDIGVLYDDHPGLARFLGVALRTQGYRVRYNEPYSGRAGLIYSARRHGNAHRIPYVELEINNALIRTEPGAVRVARDVARALMAISAAGPRRRGDPGVATLRSSR
jgi:predicted N-formylglutamate amidohydrolase